MANGFGERISELIQHLRKNGGKADWETLCAYKHGQLGEGGKVLTILHRFSSLEVWLSRPYSLWFFRCIYFEVRNCILARTIDLITCEVSCCHSAVDWLVRWISSHKAYFRCAQFGACNVLKFRSA